MALRRRDLLKAGAAGGLVLTYGAWGCDGGTKPAARTEPPPPASDTTSGAAAVESELSGWVRIGTDGSVTMVIAESEMGQGVLTALAMILAEELGADWQRVRAVHARSNEAVYGRQSTGGSTSVRNGYDKLREVGAQGRAMLVAAAAKRWQVPAAEIQVKAGVVRHDGTGKQARFGELAAEAAKQPVPADAKLSDPKSFRLIGRPTKRLDAPDKLRGAAVFGMDVKVPGMLVATVARPPVFGGKLKKLDAKAARAVAGVRRVVEVPSGVAVIADDTWAAIQGRGALACEWDDGGHGALSSEAITESCKKRVDRGAVARNDGDVRKVLGRPGTIEAVYEAPFLAHATMELLNATADVRPDRCVIWAPTQAPFQSQRVAAEITGLPMDKVQVNVTHLGCGFGRRAMTDFLAEAVHASKAAGKPVKVVWTREDDVRGGYYRPVSYNKLAANLQDGKPMAWQHQIVGPSIRDTLGRPAPEGEAEYQAVGGAVGLPYAIPNVRVTYAKLPLPIPVGYWRSVAHSQNAYVTECFVDELAAAAKADPFEFRRNLLTDKPRHRAVLERAAEAASWGKPLPAGHARGLAVHESYGSFVAQVAEVSQRGSKVVVHRVTCAVDCGQVINPLTVEAQMEGGIVVGLSAALYGRIDIAAGRAVQSNFHDYPVMRMEEMPSIRTLVVPSGDPVGGIGEPAVPVIVPAVCNAVFALTGKPVRRLPLQTS